MALDCREVRTDFNCDSCFEITFDNCSEININPGLSPDTIFYLNLFDQFDLKRVQEIVSNPDGSFDIDLSILPDNYFNPFGNYDLYISSDEEGEIIIPLSFNTEEYTCVILIINANNL